MGNKYQIYGKRVTAQQLADWLAVFADEVAAGKWKKMPYVDWRYLQAELKRVKSTNNFCLVSMVNGTLDGLTVIIPPDAEYFDNAVVVDVGDKSFGGFLWEKVPLMRNDFIRRADYQIAYEHLPSPGDYLARSYETYLENVPTNQFNYYTQINKETTIMKNEEENKNMFNFDFGPCGDTVRLSMYGIAVKNVNGNYVSYDKINDEIIDVDILNFEGGQYCYKMPVAITGVKVGDTVIHAKKPMFVLKVGAGDLTVIDVVNGEKKTIMPTKSMFGFDFVTKVISLVDSFGGAGATADSPFGNMLPLLLLSDKKCDTNTLLALTMMNGGAGNLTSNPMMLYFLMGNKGGSKDIDPFMMMMLMNATGGALSAPTANVNTVNSVSKENPKPTVKLPE